MSLVQNLVTTAVRESAAPDPGTVKQKQQAIWASGDFAVIGTTLQIVGKSLAKAADVRAGERVLRVVRSGGRIGLANWTPEGFIGQLFKVVGAYVPPPTGVKSPALWGTERHLVELFGAHAADIHVERKHFNFRYRSAAHWLQIFRDHYGPTHKAFAALDPSGRSPSRPRSARCSTA